MEPCDFEVEVSGLSRVYAEIKLMFEETDGPQTNKAEPYLLAHAAFAATTGEKRLYGTLRYALTRNDWHSENKTRHTQADRDRLCQLVRDRLPTDIAAMDRGENPAHLDPDMPLFLPVES